MGYLGEEIKKLGFGLMRLPMNGEEIDMEQTKKMVDHFMSKGFTYFDTAYVYIGGKSEVALKEAVVDRYPRESFQTATKLPMFALENRDDMERIFKESCDRAGLEYYDFYLLHALGKESFEKSERVGAWDYLKELKAAGKIRHMGFSFHDSAEVLEEILSKHPETEFVQLQINYADWESDSVQARKCYEVARKYNVPIIIMEPVKGGSLAMMTPEVQDVLKQANPDASLASWAMRYAASLDGIITVLSGMSNMEQTEDNVSYMENFEYLTGDERKTIDKAVEMLNKIPTIPCTSCKYCVDDCPQKINIPEIFGVTNFYLTYQNKAGCSWQYNNAVKDRGVPSDCIACGVCESRCPQHIEIIEELAKAAQIFE
jgi:Predicted oxidoreductases of the aldo/keto reductase family